MKRFLRILTSTIIGPLPQIIFFYIANKDESIKEGIGTTWYEISIFVIFCLTALIPIIYGIVWSSDSGIGSYFLNQILIPIGLGLLGLIIFFIFSVIISLIVDPTAIFLLIVLFALISIGGPILIIIIY